MNGLFPGLFWGLFLLLLGASVLLKAVFRVDLPVLRVFVGLLLIYVGVKVLVGGRFRSPDGHEAYFGSTRLSQPHDGAKIGVIFGKGVLDLATMGWKGANMFLESNTVFGHSTLRLDPEVPTRVLVSAAFAGASFPDGSVLSFGEHVYHNKAYAEGRPCVTVKASVVFGALDVTD